MALMKPWCTVVVVSLLLATILLLVVAPAALAETSQTPPAPGSASDPCPDVLIHLPRIIWKSASIQLRIQDSISTTAGGAWIHRNIKNTEPKRNLDM